MAFFRRFDGPDPVGRAAAGDREIRPGRSSVLATGTLACPRCDVPVALGAATVTPSAPLGCPYCGHAGAVRDFLSLEAPARPARVQVRVAARPRSRAVRR
jgi:hypothetical protein